MVVSSSVQILNHNPQAYDGHMNLILSDVEETIMLVDGMEGAPPGQGVVNVSLTSPPSTTIFVLT